MNIGKRSYLLLSGGQDSLACLLWARDRFSLIEAVSFDYGQRHDKEIDYARALAEAFHLQHTVYSIGNFLKSIAPSSLFDSSEAKNIHDGAHIKSAHLPASFVPNRNGIFLTLCANHAYVKEEDRIDIIIGACQTDYAGYPDCRDLYIRMKALELSLGLDRTVNIHTPLMWLRKAEIFALADKNGYLKTMLEKTMTCYNGSEDRNDWGKGCGQCPACRLRKSGYLEFLSEKA